MFPWNFSPFNKKMNQNGQLDHNEIEKFVKEMMGQMMPSQMQGMINSQESMKTVKNQQTNQESNNYNGEALSYSVFDTHKHVFVRIRIKDESWLSQLKLYHTSNQLFVEHIPNQYDKQTITLPAIVRKKGTTTIYKDGILEISIPKNIDLQFSEIEITEKS